MALTPDARDKLLYSAQRMLAANRAADLALDALREREQRTRDLIIALQESIRELDEARQAVHEAQRSCMAFFGECLDPVLGK